MLFCSIASLPRHKGRSDLEQTDTDDMIEEHVKTISLVTAKVD